MAEPEFSDLAVVGQRIAVRVTPKAARNQIDRDGDLIRIRVTAAPVDGKATAACIKLLSKVLGVPKSRLRLVRGETARDKLFEVLD